MNILFFHAGFGYGGASKMMVEIANHFSVNHNVTVLAYRYNIMKQQLAPNVNYVFDELYKSRFKPLAIIGQIRALNKYIKKNKIDVVIAFLHPSNYMATIAAVGTQAKVILSERGDPYSRLKNGNLYVKLVEKILHKANGYVFQSDGAAQAYPQKCRNRGRVIVNAIPTKEYPSHRITDNKEIINVARLENIQKRQDVLLEAFSFFHRLHPEYRLTFVGHGPDLNRLKQYSEKLGINHSVLFLGERKDVLELVSNATIFVLSSDYEGLPNALMEAMIVGTPCVSTDCSPGGARMIIRDGYNGFIVEAGNPEALAEKMTTLADSEELQILFSQRSPKYILDNFSPERFYKGWDELLIQIKDMD